MANDIIRQRKPVLEMLDKAHGAKGKVENEHPGGDVKHGGPEELLRMFLFLAYFMGCCCSIFTTQLFGVPLYWVNKDLYYAYMAHTKQSFGIVVTTVTQWWSPTVVRMSGDASVAGQLRETPDGRVECEFPDRMVMVANHQLYSDWLYLWWIAYTNKPRMHGHIYIILKESLKYLPIIGWGMMFYGFIFMSRKMSTDQPRIAHRLNKLKEHHAGPLSGTKGLDPMWLLIFPEGTNASDNGRIKSAAWAKKSGIQDMQHTLLPRSTGSFFCLNELKDTVDYVYDCTFAYEGIPRAEFGQDYYTLRSIYFRGQPPPSVNMYWRRFAVKDIPLDNIEKFDLWLRERWQEKDDLIEQYLTTGRFPANASANGAVNGNGKGGFIETQVKLMHWWEVGSIFVVLAGLALVFNILARIWESVIYGKK